MSTPQSPTVARPASGLWLLPYGIVVLAVTVMTLLLDQLPGRIEVALILFVYMMVVIGTALRFGSGPAILSAILAYMAYAWFFGEPRHSLAVHDPSEWFALVMFLVTAGVIGNLMALQRRHADEARRRAQEATALADVSWTIAAQLNQEQALMVALRRLVEILGARLAIITIPDEDGPRQVARFGQHELAPPDLTAAAFRERVAAVVATGAPLGWTEPLPDDEAFLPLTVEQRTLGVLYLQRPPRQGVSPSARNVAESLARLAAVILERERLAKAETHVQALAEADRLKTALLSMVSHDFRSPLASIKASVSGLLQDEHPVAAETGRDLLEGIERETDRLNRMVGNVLNLSRLDADAWRPIVEPVPPVELVGAALSAFDSAGSGRIRAQVDPRLPEVPLDPVQMAQVIHNLVDNALKFSAPAGMVEVEARVGDAFVVEVRDRGPGLQPGEETRIFERFYRAPNLTESNVPGAGIGLAVCKGLVEAHGGRISARNRDGGGTVFRIDVPLDRPDHRPAAGGNP